VSLSVYVSENGNGFMHGIEKEKKKALASYRATKRTRSHTAAVSLAKYTR
jgi:hypothetical protein